MGIVRHFAGDFFGVGCVRYLCIKDEIKNMLCILCLYGACKSFVGDWKLRFVNKFDICADTKICWEHSGKAAVVDKDDWCCIVGCVSGGGGDNW